ADFAAMARAFGGLGLPGERTADFPDAFERALAHEGLSLVHCLTDPSLRGARLPNRPDSGRLMTIDAIVTDLHAHTLDPERPRASRIGVFNGRIIGFDEDLDGISADRIESLGGATVLPGFTDAHCHTAWFGLTLASVDVTALPGGLPDVYAALEEAAAA